MRDANGIDESEAGLQMDVLIPARRGSVGLPGKNKMTLVDRPLFLHSVACAHLLPHVRSIFVSTDDPEIAELALEAGAIVPELRPAALAKSETPMAAVIQYAMPVLTRTFGSEAECLLLLDPTSPMRTVSDIREAKDRLEASAEAVGVISVSRPVFNPLWVGVEVDEWSRASRHTSMPNVYTRRQDVPDYLRVNGSFYLWRSRFAKSLTTRWLDEGPHLAQVTSELLSHSIDTHEDFELARVLLMSKLITLPWMKESNE